MSEYFISLAPKIENKKSNHYKSDSTYIYLDKKRNTCLFQIKNFSTIYSVIIPFFSQYPVLGVKFLDFEDFKKVS
jgi:hypothetical protein